jgi:hypothetical protein
MLIPPLRQPQNVLYLGYSAAVIQRFHWHQAEARALLVALLLPIVALAATALTRRQPRGRWLGGILIASALVRVALAGSLASEAVRDPLFWGLVAAAAFAVAVGTGRWPVLAASASAIGGGAAAVATLIPNFPNFAVEFPGLDRGAIARSLSAMSSQFGVPATVFLLGLWVYAIAFDWRDGADRVQAAMRGALLAGLVLCLAGAMPTPIVSFASLAVLGCLVGFAVSRGTRGA